MAGSLFGSQGSSFGGFGGSNFPTLTSSLANGASGGYDAWNVKMDPADVWGAKARQDQARMQGQLSDQKSAIQQQMKSRPEFMSTRDGGGRLLDEFKYKGQTVDAATAGTETVKDTVAAAGGKAGVAKTKASRATLTNANTVDAKVGKAATKEAKLRETKASLGSVGKATTQDANAASVDWRGLDTRLGGAKDISGRGLDYAGDVNSGRGAALADQDVQSLRGEAFGAGPSAWAQAMQGQQDLTKSSALDQLARDNRNSSAQAMQDLAMQGGLSGGAAERVAKAGARDQVMGGQNIARQDASARLGITADDESRKASLRQQMPGMNLQLDQYGAGLSEANRQARTQAGMFNSQQDFGAQQANQNLAMGKAQTWAGLQEAQAARQTATNQFNASNQNQASQFNTGQQNAMSQFNANAQNQVGQFNAAAANQLGMYNAGQSNDTERMNVAAQNQANLFNAGAQNQASQFNAGAANQMSQYNVGQQNQASLANAAASNQVGMFNTGQQNALNQFNAASQNQMNQYNVGQQNAMSQFNTNAQNQAGQFNANVFNQEGMVNTGNAIMDNRMNNAFNMDQWNQGMQALGAQGTAQAMANQQSKGGFLSNLFS